MKLVIVVTLVACALAAPKQRILSTGLVPPLVFSIDQFHKLISDDKIVGGTEVLPNSLPFQISFQRKGILGFSHLCGGSIIDETTILTAAHCVEGNNDVSILRIVAGEHNLTEVGDLEQIVEISSYVYHPKYNYDTLENDIAVVKLNNSLDISVSSVKPINLPPPTSELDPPAGTLVTVSGWGTTSNGGSLSDVLLSAELPVVSDEECNAAYAVEFNANPVKETMMCAGNLNGGVDSCQGDSGGPLFTANGDGTFVQHGIVSWGRGCALAGYPGVYTQVSYFLDWINKNSR